MKPATTNIERAQVFYETGEWFMNLPECSVVNMGQGHAYVDENYKCNSPACFGGWLAVKYKTPIKTISKHVSFFDGWDEFSKHLGLQDVEVWAMNNKDLWGNDYGGHIFDDSGEYAFNEGGNMYTESNITTKAIGEKLIAVAHRIAKKEGVNLDDYMYKKQKTLLRESVVS